MELDHFDPKRKMAGARRPQVYRIGGSADRNIALSDTAVTAYVPVHDGALVPWRESGYVCAMNLTQED